MAYLVSVDIEADGAYPGDYSMVSFGAIVVEPELKKKFYSGIIAPISGKWNPEALAVSGFSREQCIKEGTEASEKMREFKAWLDSFGGNPVFIADNPAFDFAFMNYYFHYFQGKNPFGFSARRIGDLFCGAEKNLWYKWKQHRRTKHSHNALDDAMGNAEAILYLSKTYGIKLP